MFLRSAKLIITRLAAQLGVSTLIMNSPWRRSRVLILCYHGVSIGDEHHWSHGLYVSPETFRNRLRRLQKLRCNVLPLGEAIERLHANTLPPRSVVLTFDDGFFDFYSVAWPILKEFSYPATVYLTTYYSQHPWPVFDLMARYILWKAAGTTLRWPEITQRSIQLDAAGLEEVTAQLQSHVQNARLSGSEKDQLLSELAARTNVPLDDYRRQRILHLMNSDEVRAVSLEGADVQLHTHRHRLFPRRERFWQEIDENREIVTGITHKPVAHFCYPGGLTRPEFPEWLRQRGVLTATTCYPGIASRDVDPLLIPRLLDTNLSDHEFNSWLTGFAALMPKRHFVAGESQLGIEGASETREAGSLIARG